jgi:hypothetical protein
MSRLTPSFAIACGAALFSTTANAETVEDLKRELAAKKAYIAKLERRLRDLEQRPPAPKPTLVTAPVAPPPPRVAVATPPPSPEDEEMERALTQTSGAGNAKSTTANLNSTRQKVVEANASVTQSVSD